MRKTTLIKSILGMVIPDKEITVNNENTSSGFEYRRHIGYIPTNRKGIHKHDYWANFLK